MFRFFTSPAASPLHARLAASPLFATLSPRELRIVGALIHERHYLAGEVIFDQGDEGQAIYTVLSGRVAICRQGDSGSGLFGELALIDGGPRSAQARALDDCALGVMFRGDFTGLMTAHAAIAGKLSFQLARHYAGIIRRLAAAPDAAP
ncbi:MAG: cyclic nucleotide-binding domain-containing protein [Proteobacteria bacterium]|nr:cyclic nucleotide-binding domain-containing protein [Pseudomonadota bacterium]